MKTFLHIIDGIQLLVTQDIVDNLPVEFLPSCGAGDGTGNALVSEKIFGLSITIACYIHDKMWQEALPTWDDFHHSNSVFLHNIMAIIKAKSHNIFVEHIRNYRAVSYYNAVDTAGIIFFAKAKIS